MTPKEENALSAPIALPSVARLTGVPLQLGADSFRQYTINYNPPAGYGFIYKITSPSGKSYVGQTIKSIAARFGLHCKKYGECRLITRAIMKYGKSNMTVECIGTFHISILGNAEREMILLHRSLYPNGYNLNDGGDCNFVFSKITLRKMSDSHRGKKFSDSHRNNISLSSKGKVMSEESRRKMSEAKSTQEAKNRCSEIAKSRWKENDYRAKVLSAHIGKKRSAEACANIGASRRTPEARARQSEILKEQWKNPVYREKMLMQMRALNLHNKDMRKAI